jgi:hypothetical protein
MTTLPVGPETGRRRNLLILRQGKNTVVGSILKSNRESGQQFGVLDPHGDTLRRN